MLNSLDADQIKKVVKALSENSDLGVSVTKVRTSWQGGFKVETDVKGFKVMVDEPCSLGGTDTAPNPMALLLSSYGACLAISYIFIATMRGCAIDRLEIELEGDVDLPLFRAYNNKNVPDSSMGFSEVRTRLYVKSRAPLEELEEIHRLAVSKSPVGQTIVKPIKVINEFSRRRLA